MATLLPDPLYEISGVGPPPDKNFYFLVVTKSDVNWRWWKISPRASGPGEMTRSHQDYLHDTWLHGEVSLIFGHQILQYTKALCQGHYDYLDHLPDPLLFKIMNYLELDDVGQLGRTSRRFRRLCESEEFWEQAVRHRCTTVSTEMASLAVDFGWRNIFFMGKLQLQTLISRRRLTTDEQQKGDVSDSDTKAEKSPDESLDVKHTSNLGDKSYSCMSNNNSLGAASVTGPNRKSCSCT